MNRPQMPTQAQGTPMGGKPQSPMGGPPQGMPAQAQGTPMGGKPPMPPQGMPGTPMGGMPQMPPQAQGDPMKRQQMMANMMRGGPNNG